MTRTMVFVMVAVVVAVGAGTPASAQVDPEWQDVIRRLRHPDVRTRLDAVNRLASAGYRAAAEPVAALLTDVDDSVQLAAIDAQLAFFLADRPAGGRRFGIGSSRSPAQEAYEAGPLLRGAAPVPASVLEQLLAAVRDGNARVRFDALHTFGFLAEAPVSDDLARRLAEELDHYDPIIRAAAARVIGRLRATGTADALARAIVDVNPMVRQYATEATGLIRDTKSLATLRAHLDRARGEMVAVTLLAIARMGMAEDADRFHQRLQDRAPAVRRAAVEGLGWIADRESLPTLEAILAADRADEVRLAAACALQRMGQSHSHVIAPMLVLRDVNAQARDCLFEIGPAAVPGIVATLQVATDSRHRADLVQLTGYLGAATDVAVLEPLVADPDERVRRVVGHAITRLRR